MSRTTTFVHGVLRHGSALALVALLGAPPVWAELKTDSVVKVFVNKNSMDYMNPWQSHGGQQVSGSGSIIAGHRILTNAHVVNDSTFIQVRKEGDSKKYVATVEAVGEDCDLALLRVDDPDFFKGVAPLEFGGLPHLQDSVTALGYPMGGDVLSITEGVVSRVEIIPYAQSGRPLLGVQIDAAINPGNSGGPVLENGKIVGVAMQGITSGQNIGYMIPVPIITHFLDDLQHESYDGVPLLGVTFHNTENASLRRYYGIPGDAGGVVVDHVFPFSSADGILQTGDVILALDGTPVASDGTVPFREHERLSMSYLINAKQVGETIDVQVLRHGQTSTIKLTMKAFQDLVPIANWSPKPSYYIYGGLVFTILSTDMINEWRNILGPDAENKMPISFLYWAYGAGQLNEERKKEVVVLLEVLPDSINVGYDGRQPDVITTVNGHAFSSFKEFVTLVEHTKEAYVVFESEERQRMIISAKDAARATADIIARNHVPSRCSDDVAKWLAH